MVRFLEYIRTPNIFLNDNTTGGLRRSRKISTLPESLFMALYSSRFSQCSFSRQLSFVEYTFALFFFGFSLLCLRMCWKTCVSSGKVLENPIISLANKNCGISGTGAHFPISIDNTCFVWINHQRTIINKVYNRVSKICFCISFMVSPSLSITRSGYINLILVMNIYQYWADQRMWSIISLFHRQRFLEESSALGLILIRVDNILCRLLTSFGKRSISELARYEFINNFWFVKYAKVRLREI